MEGEPLSFAGAATSWPHLGCSAQRLNGDFLLQKPSPSALSETPASSRASLSSPRTTRALGSMTGGLSEDPRSSLRLKGTSLEGAGAARPGPSQGLGAAIFAWAPGSEGKAPWQHKAQGLFPRRLVAEWKERETAKAKAKAFVTALPSRAVAASSRLSARRSASWHEASLRKFPGTSDLLPPWTAPADTSA